MLLLAEWLATQKCFYVFLLHKYAAFNIETRCFMHPVFGLWTTDWAGCMALQQLRRILTMLITSFAKASTYLHTTRNT